MMEMYKIKTDKFEGPLDVLLQMIEKNKVDITDFSLAEVAGDFLDFIREKEGRGEKLRSLSEFLKIASSLAFLKSKALLPEIELNQKEEEDIEELKFRLKKYRQFKQASKEIGKILNNGGEMKRRRLEKTLSNEENNKKDFRGKIETGKLFDFYRELRNEILEIKKRAQEEKEEKLDYISLSEKIDQIENILTKKWKIAFLKVVSNVENKEEVVVSFLSVLQLLKQKNINLKQERLFGEILIEKRN